MTGGGSITDSAGPSIHAVGGSLGSALALLLLYPLERARVELQTMPASNNNNNNNNRLSGADFIMHGKSEQLLAQEQLEPRASRGGGALAVVAPPSNDKEQEERTPRDSLSEESWESCLKPDDVGVTMSPSSSEDEFFLSGATSSQKQKRLQRKVGLLSCLLALHRRGQLYRGVTPVVTTMATSNFVFFYVHAYLKLLLSRGPYQQNKLRLSLLASTLAGIMNVLITNPLWVANLRIVTSDSSSSSSSKCSDDDSSHNSNLWTEIRRIAKQEGWPQLWSGTWASLLLVSNPVIQFFTYEQLKSQLLQSRNNHPSHDTGNLKPLEAFLLGALAKAISTVLTYPLQLTQTVMRVQKQEEQEKGESSAEPSDMNSKSLSGATTNPQSHQHSRTGTQHQYYRGTLDCLVKIYRQKGIEGWFAGMQTKLLQTVLTAAFTFLSYEQIIKALMAVHRALVVKDAHPLSSGRPPRANAPVP